MTERRQALGHQGEAAAKAFLRRRGYRILRENFATVVGEVDLIAQHRRTVVFVEVKTRSGGEFGPPQAAVGLAKQRQIVRAAEAFLGGARLGPVACRFDVIAVTLGPEGAAPGIEWIQDAFPAEGVRLF